MAVDLNHIQCLFEESLAQIGAYRETEEYGRVCRGHLARVFQNPTPSVGGTAFSFSPTRTIISFRPRLVTVVLSGVIST